MLHEVAQTIELCFWKDGKRERHKEEEEEENKTVGHVMIYIT